MATELGMKSGISVGWQLSALQKKLPKDHFIRQIKGGDKQIGRKRIYHLEGIEPQIITHEQENIKEYFEDKGEQFFREGGYIIVAEMATELEMKSKAVGQHLGGLKNKLPNDHFIHKIKSNDWWIRGERIYHLEGIEPQILKPITPEQEKNKRIL